MPQIVNRLADPDVADPDVAKCCMLEFQYIADIRKATSVMQKIAVQELINRTVGRCSDAFEVSIDYKLDFRSFEISTTYEKVYIRAYDGISAAKGFHCYLKYYLSKSIYWYNDLVQLSRFVVVPNIRMLSKCESSLIYYQNVCTWGYSFAWWNWSTWIKHIDWMAMMGVSLTIAPVQEYIWYETYSELGLTEEEINDHFSGPGFLPWLRMGNIRGWAGPMPPVLRKMQMVLQRKIIDRQRMFGMKVAIPAFSGYVPIAMKRVFPNTTFLIADPWNKFPDIYCCSLFVNPFEKFFDIVGGLFLRKVIGYYGTDHIYFVDPFNEMQPQSSDPKYLNKTAHYIFKSIHNVDTWAIWLLQGWMFVKNAFWSDNQIRAFLTAVSKGRMLVLDLQSEQFPQYERTYSFYGQPFVWCMLHNFGGTLGMHGSVEIVNKEIRHARSIVNSSMVGVGITPEGINQNYVMYGLVLERAWLKDDINLTEWFDMYVDTRYGIVDGKLRESWRILRKSVYSYTGSKKIHGKYVVARRPSVHLNIWTWYNVSDIYDSLKRMLACNYKIPYNYYNEYKYDLVDLTRQLLQTIGELVYVNLIDAYKKRQYYRFEKLAHKILDIMLDLEDILATDSNFLLGNWIEDAKKVSKNSQQKELYEFNARNQITLWGPTGEIIDYATKQWSGIVTDFFQPRWKLFIEYLRMSLYDDRPFRSSVFNNDVFHRIENPFNYQRKIYPTHSLGNSFYSSRRIFTKWVNIVLNDGINDNIFRINVKHYGISNIRSNLIKQAQQILK